MDEMKWAMGFEEGGICASEPAEEVFSEYACSTDFEGFARSLDSAFVCETCGGTRAT